MISVHNTKLGPYQVLKFKEQKYSPAMKSPAFLLSKSLEEAEAHMDTGEHVKASEYESVYDSAKKIWAERVTEVNLVSSGEVDSSVDTVQSEPSQYSAKKGWALKSTKRANRM